MADLSPKRTLINSNQLSKLIVLAGVALLSVYIILVAFLFYETQDKIAQSEASGQNSIVNLVGDINISIWAIDELTDSDNGDVDINSVTSHLENIQSKLKSLEQITQNLPHTPEYSKGFNEANRLIDELEADMGRGRSTPDQIRSMVKTSGKSLAETVHRLILEAQQIHNNRFAHTLSEISGQNTHFLWISGAFIVLAGGMIFYLLWDINRREELLSKASSAERLKSSFFAMMSHEIRTPINAIMGMLTLLKDGQLTSEQQHYVNTAHTSADALLTIINDVLDYSKIEAGKLEIEYRSFNIRDLMKGTVELLQPLAKAKGLELYYEMDGQIPETLYADPMRVRQIVINFASNAIKFTEKGFVRIEVMRETMRKEDVESTFVRFAVIDSGIGIKDEAKNLLFREFSQVDGSHARRFEGTGLGLAICKRLTEMMKGYIGVTSALGRGSTFWFSLPLVIDRSAIKSAQDSVSHAQPNGTTLRHTQASILLAEDNLTNQLIAKAFLEKGGHAVSVANNGLEAVALAKTKNFDLVLTDISMPQMDGYAATKALRQMNDHYRSVPIIAMTAHAMMGDRETCLKAGMDDYITKPVSRDALLSMITKWIGENATSNMTPPETKPAPPASEEAEINETYFNQIVQDLSLEGAHNFAKIFIEDLSRTGQAMLDMAATNNWDKAKTHAHSLKSSTLSFGLTRLSRLAENIEAQCKANGRADAAYFTQWPAYEASALAALRERFAKTGMPL